jgi:hypothetical protein
LWQILLQKSKIEEARKSRENRFLDAPAVARLSGVNTKVGGRFGMKRCGPPHVATRETHQRSLKFWYFTRKRLLQQYLPTAEVGSALVKNRPDGPKFDFRSSPESGL